MCLHSWMKLWAMSCRATQDGHVILKTTDKMWYTGGGNRKALQYSYCENSMIIMKRQKDVAPEDAPPRSEGVQCSTAEEQYPNHQCQRSLNWLVLWRPTRSSRSNTRNRCPFHHMGLKFKSRKSKDTWSKEQVWP